MEQGRERGFATNAYSLKRWTTLSVDLELKDKIATAINISGKKMSYNSALNRIVDEWIEQNRKKGE